MMNGIVPVMTQGSMAFYFGGDLVIQEIQRTEKNLDPSLIIPVFFFLSLLFQMCLYLYKVIRSRKQRNTKNNNYMNSLKTILGKYYYY